MQPSCQSCCDASDAAYAGLWHLKPCAVSGICISKKKKILARRFPVLPDGCCPLCARVRMQHGGTATVGRWPGGVSTQAGGLSACMRAHL